MALRSVVYDKVIFKQGSILTAEELNELQQLIIERERTFVNEVFGTSRIGRGFFVRFKDTNTVTVLKGCVFADGWLWKLDNDVDISLKSGGKNYIYAILRYKEIGVADDVNLYLYWGGGRLETSRRLKRELEIGSSLTIPSPAPNETVIILAEVNPNPQGQYDIEQKIRTQVKAVVGEPEIPAIPNRVRVSWSLVQSVVAEANIYRAKVKVEWGDKFYGVRVSNNKLKKISNIVGDWIEGEWVGHYVYDSNGDFFKVLDNTRDTLTLDGTPAEGNAVLTPNAVAYDVQIETKDAKASEVPGEFEEILPSVEGEVYYHTYHSPNVHWEDRYIANRENRLTSVAASSPVPMEYVFWSECQARHRIRVASLGGFGKDYMSAYSNWVYIALRIPASVRELMAPIRNEIDVEKSPGRVIVVLREFSQENRQRYEYLRKYWNGIKIAYSEGENTARVKFNQQNQQQQVQVPAPPLTRTQEVHFLEPTTSARVPIVCEPGSRVRIFIAYQLKDNSLTPYREFDEGFFGVPREESWGYGILVPRLEPVIRFPQQVISVPFSQIVYSDVALDDGNLPEYILTVSPNGGGQKIVYQSYLVKGSVVRVRAVFEAKVSSSFPSGRGIKLRYGSLEAKLENLSTSYEQREIILGVDTLSSTGTYLLQLIMYFDNGRSGSLWMRNVCIIFDYSLTQRLGQQV
jgi:hypothetical protein